MNPIDTITAGCTDIPSSFESLPILRTTKELSLQEAITLKGKSVDSLFASKKPFVVTIPDFSNRSVWAIDDAHGDQHSFCNDLKSACLMLITEPDSKTTLPAVISIHVQTTKVEPQSLWSLLLPLTVPLDFAAIIAYFSVIVFGGAMGGG